MKRIIINSNEKTNGTYFLTDFVMNNSLYNVNNNNNKIYFAEGGSLTATLTNGYYTRNDLASEIKTQMDATGAETYTVSYNNITGKYTFSATGNFNFEFATNTTNSSRKLLGFNEEDTVSNTQITSSNIVDLSSYKFIYVNIKENKISQYYGKNYFSASLKINDNSSFLSNIRYEYKADSNRQYVKFNNTKSIKYEFYDENFNELDFNGNEWSMIFEKDIIDKELEDKKNNLMDYSNTFYGLR